MKKVLLEFQDDGQANLFRDEMKRRFRYPKTASRNEVVHGKDENGNAVFVNSLDRFGVFSSVLLSRENKGAFFLQNALYFSLTKCYNAFSEVRI